MAEIRLHHFRSGQHPLGRGPGDPPRGKPDVCLAGRGGARVPKPTMTQDTLLEIRQQVVDDPARAFGHDVSGLREAVLYRGMRRLGLAEPDRRADYARQAFPGVLRSAPGSGLLRARAGRAGGTRRANISSLRSPTAMPTSRRSVWIKYFAFAYSSADVSASKPAPDIFHAALDRAGVYSLRIHPRRRSSGGRHTRRGQRRHAHHLGKSRQARPDAEGHTQPTAVVERLRDLPEAVRRIHDG